MRALGSIAALSTALTLGICAASALAAERSVRFSGGNGVVLAGTLAMPSDVDAASRVPAVLLLQGSGPTDRDGNQLPGIRTDVLRQVAAILAQQGIASLRYDKRGMHANRSTLPARRDELPSFFDWSAFVADAQAALRFLGGQPTVVADRVGIFGHSEGGLIALVAASHAQQRPKVLVLAGTPGRPLGEVIEEQTAALLERQHATAAQTRFFIDADSRIQSEILASGRVPADVPPGLAFFFPAYLGPYLNLKSVLALEPAPLTNEFAGPILVINGAADTQVSAVRDAALFSAALASRKDGSKVFVPTGVSHNLKTVANGDDPGLEGPMDANVTNELVRWLKTAL